jgi:hypothetical protein
VEVLPVECPAFGKNDLKELVNINESDIFTCFLLSMLSLLGNFLIQKNKTIQ